MKIGSEKSEIPEIKKFASPQRLFSPAKVLIRVSTFTRPSPPITSVLFRHRTRSVVLCGAQVPRN